MNAFWRCMTLGAAVLLPSTAFPQQTETARFLVRFEKDKPYLQEIATTARQSMKGMGCDATYQLKQTFVFRCSPQGRDAAGRWIVKQTLVDVHMEFTIGDTVTGPGMRFLNALKGAEFTVQLSPQLTIEKIEGYRSLATKLHKADPGNAALLEMAFSEELLSQLFLPLVAWHPNKAMAAGGSWQRSFDYNFGPMGKYVVHNQYTYGGRTGALDTISFASEVKYRAPAAGVKTELTSFKVDGLQTKEGKGTLHFDAMKGRVDSVSAVVVIEGIQAIDVGGQTVTIELRQRLETKVRCYEEK